MQSGGRAVFAASALASAFGIYQARKPPARIRVEVPITNLPDALDALKICQASDIHIGLTIQKTYIETIVDSINASKADIIALTGDLVDGTVEQLYEHAQVLQKLHAAYGSYFVTGNHEYYSGAMPWIELFRSWGIRPLLNEHVVIRKNGAPLILAGVNDYSAHRFIAEHKTDPKAAIQACTLQGPEVPKILLAHQPKSIFAASQCGYDLQLSGHTHGGQFFPWNLVVKLLQPYERGLHLHEKTWIYVSKGTGYWGPPMRVGADSEITEIILRKA